MASRSGLTLAEVGISTAIVALAVTATVLATTRVSQMQARSADRIEAAITATTLISRAQHYSPLLQVNAAMDCYSFFAVPSLAQVPLRVEDHLHGPRGVQCEYLSIASNRVTWEAYTWDLDWKLFGGNPSITTAPPATRAYAPTVLADAGTFGFWSTSYASRDWDWWTVYGQGSVIAQLRGTGYLTFQPPPPIPNDRRVCVLSGEWNHPLDVRRSGSLGYPGGEDPITVLGELADRTYAQTGSIPALKLTATDALVTDEDEHRWLDTAPASLRRTDKGEPFTDLNRNGSLDAGEDFRDLDGNGSYTTTGRRRLYFVHAANRLWSWQSGEAPLPKAGDVSNYDVSRNPWLVYSPMATKLVGFSTARDGLTLYRGGSAWTGPRCREMTVWAGPFRRTQAFQAAMGNIQPDDSIPFQSQVRLATVGRFLFFDPGDR